MAAARYPILMFLLALVMMGPADAVAADPQAARARVEAAVNEGLGTFTDSSHSLAERTRLLDGLLRRYSDPGMLSAYILGRHWGRLSAAEQDGFSETFLRYLVSSYVGLLKNLKTGVAVRIDDAADSGGRYRVASTVTLPSQPHIPVPVDWEVAAAPDGRLVIIDVTADGVSIIRAMREDFASVLRGSGGRIDPLVEALRRKIADNEAGNARSP